MNFCPNNFVGNPNFYDDVLDILTSTLPSCSLGPLFAGSNSRTIIDDRYDEMKAHFCVCKSNIQLERPYSLSSLTPFGINNSATNVGHDLPIWFSPSDEPPCDDIFCDFLDLRLKGKKIMIIGSAPQRKNQFANYITLSTPWGLHHCQYRNGGSVISMGAHLVGGSNNSSGKPHAFLLNQIVNRLVMNGAFVYITDAFKLFSDNAISSSQITLYPSILEDEIKLFKPDFIYLLGKNAQILGAMSPIIRKYGIIVLYHPNARELNGTILQRCKYYTYNLEKELNSQTGINKQTIGDNIYKAWEDYNRNSKKKMSISEFEKECGIPSNLNIFLQEKVDEELLKKISEVLDHDVTM